MNEKPDHQRPEHPDFWDKRFDAGTTPWNAGGVPGALADFAETISGQPRTLIPGCGHAWEAAWLAAQDWEVTALDFSAAAVDAARQQLGEWPGQLVLGDFFEFSPPGGGNGAYELIYERAFLCALPRKCWQDYGRRMHELLAPGGRLVGFFFFSDEPKGPPFGITPAELDRLLSPWFECEDDRAVSDSIPVFAGRERWQVWRRKQAATPAA
jgi:thiopurine S-methyltransferase